MGLTPSQRAFVYDASHELRDPLTVCRGPLELVGEDPEERRRTLALVMDELERMARIIDQLSMLADLEQPQFLRAEPIDLGLFAHELAAAAGALAPRRWMLDLAGEGTFSGDRLRLTEAVMELVHNAVQHTLPGEAVTIGTSLGSAEVRLSMRDRGPGISASEQDHIFERFVRGKDAQRRYRGGGLGLALVQAIAEAHDGRVELETRLGKGSTFTIVIPRRA